MITDWSDRWLGGFCAVGALGGLPVRGPDYAAHPPLDSLLTLPAADTSATDDLAAVQAAWSAALAGAPVVLLRNLERARAVLLQALAIAPGTPIGLPANATRALAEAVKQYPAVPRFLDLNADLSLRSDPAQVADLRLVWAQPCGGAWLPGVAPAETTLLIDAGDSLPDLRGEPLPTDVAALLYGLHLRIAPQDAGALLVCRDEALARAVTALLTPADRPDPAPARAQLERLSGPAGIAARQRDAFAAVQAGLVAAAGLPLLTPPAGIMAQHIAVRIPEPCDAATFYAYVLGEQTPVRWLPALRPLHYAALRAGGAPHPARSAAELARVLLVPVGPDYSEEEIRHAVLGITKAADYLGVRWYTDPPRAAWYARQMDEWYGVEHDAYRPLFAMSAG